MENNTSNVKIYLYLDVRKALKNGDHPISLVVNNSGNRKFYRTGHSTTEKYYNKCMTAQRGQAKADRQKWESYEQKAQGIVRQLSVFTFDKFERLYLSRHSANLKGYYDSKIQELSDAGRIGTATVYSDSKKSIFKFRPSLEFKDVDPAFLENYQAWMEARDRSATTIGMYVRALRALFNQAIKEGTISRDFYPFDDYVIPQGENRKRALHISELTALRSYQPMPEEEFYISLWWFSFYMNGANLKDILKLRWTDIQDDRIQFIRQKTAKTKRKTIKIRIPIDDYIQAFIDRWGDPSGTFILKPYNEHTAPSRRYEVCRQINLMINKKIKKAGEATGIKGKITLYTARHSYASLMFNNSKDINYVKEALGHTDITTTQRYLNSIDTEKEKQYRSVLKVG